MEVEKPTRSRRREVDDGRVRDQNHAPPLGGRPSMALLSFLDREHTVAGEGYSRWLVPPAALAIHLSIGQAYAFSVFNLPLTRLLGVPASAPGDWKLTTVG